jgi:imidazolonepropionase-like amidohydrolase
VTVAADLPGALDAGVDDIAHMATDRVSDATIQRMVEASVYWVPTLELWQGVGLRRAAIADNLRRFVAASGQVALGTDYLGAPNVDFDLGMPITEIELMAQAGMTPMQIIVAATRNAAHVCGLERELGTLEPGKLADVLVVDGDPLTDVHVLTQTRLVLRDGVIIMQEAAPTVKIDGYKNLGVFSLPRHVHRPDLPPIGFPRRFDEPAGVFLGGLIGHNKRVVHSAG